MKMKKIEQSFIFWSSRALLFLLFSNGILIQDFTILSTLVIRIFTTLSCKIRIIYLIIQKEGRAQFFFLRRQFVHVILRTHLTNWQLFLDYKTIYNVVCNHFWAKLMSRKRKKCDFCLKLWWKDKMIWDKQWKRI